MGDFSELIGAVRRRLQAPLPGRVALERMAAQQRPWRSIEEARAAGGREAAVLVLLFPAGEEAATVLTVRNHDLRRHGGQVSWPGGRVEPGESWSEAAQREAREELGDELSEIEILGELTPIVVPPAGFCVQPVVAAVLRPPAFRPDDREVAEVLVVPLADISDDRRVGVETWQIGGELRAVPFFAFGEHRVWGATAMVLAELAAVLAEAGAWPPAGGQ
jgi:8-oxo-dGTP pyrophosphatase MutT (NUDIX family)